MIHTLRNIFTIAALLFTHSISAQDHPQFFKTTTGAEYKICCGSAENRNQQLDSCFNADELKFYQKALAKKAAMEQTAKHQCLSSFQSQTSVSEDLKTLSQNRRPLTDEELARKRKEVMARYNEASARVVCGSSGTKTLKSFETRFKMANQKNKNEGGQEYSNAELYFFLECGENQRYMSPLAYHANHLQLDERGYLSDLTKEIIDMSMEYIDVKDPKTGKSFLDLAKGRIENARQRNDTFQMAVYEQLIRYIEIKDLHIVAEK